MASRRTLGLAGLALVLAGCALEDDAAFVKRGVPGVLVFHNGARRECERLRYSILGEGYVCLSGVALSWHPREGVASEIVTVQPERASRDAHERTSR